MAYIIRLGEDTWSSVKRLAQAYLIEVKDDRLIVQYPERETILRGNVGEMIDLIRSTLENNNPKNSLAAIKNGYYIPTRLLLEFQSGFLYNINGNRVFGIRFEHNKVVYMRCEEGEEQSIMDEIEKYYEEATNW